MNENTALNELHRTSVEKELVAQMYLAKDLLYAQDKCFPQSSVYYPIGETEPIWIAVKTIKKDTVHFFYASTVTKSVPQYPLDNRLMSAECLRQIRYWHAINPEELTFFQVITTRQKKAHHWEAAYWVSREDAIRDVFHQNAEKLKTN